MAAPDSHPHFTQFISIWAAVGPLIGVFLGQFPGRLWQRRQYVLTEPQDPSIFQDYSQKSVIFYATMRDRLFIGEKIKALEIRKRWNKATKQHEAKHDEGKFEKAIEEISAQIISIVRC
jgi:hypothetical protein